MQRLALLLSLALTVGCSGVDVEIHEVSLDVARPHSGSILDLAFIETLAGDFLATGGEDGFVRLWKLEAESAREHALPEPYRVTEEGIEPDAGPQAPVTHLIGGYGLSYWSRDTQDGGSIQGCGRTCSHGGDHSLFLFFGRPFGHEEPVRAIESAWASENGEGLLVLYEDGRLKLLQNFEAGLSLAQVSLTSDSEVHLAGRELRALVARTTPSGRPEIYVVVWSRAGLTTVSTLRLGASQTPVSVALLQDHGYVATREGELICFDYKTLGLRWSRSLPGVRVLASSGPGFLALGFEDGSLQILNAEGGPLAEVAGRTSVRSLTFSPKGDFLALGDEAGRPRLFRVVSDSRSQAKPR